MSDASTELPAADTDQAERPLTQDGPALRLYLVDGSGYIFRAYHALPPLTRKSDGLPVGRGGRASATCCGSCSCDMKGEPEAPTHLAVIFDHSEKTFRNDLYDQYKAHRPPPPEDLIPQFPLVREATAGLRRAGARAARLRGRRPDRRLCLQGARRWAARWSSSPPTRT